MVSTRRSAAAAEIVASPKQRKRRTSEPPAAAPPVIPTPQDGYEKCREERIKENLERMQKLGLFDLSLKIKSISSTSTPTRGRPPIRGGNSNTTHYSDNNKPLLLPPPTRRSSRLQNVTPVSYSEFRIMEDAKSVRRNRRVHLVEGLKEETYTDEHAKLLGSTEMTWTLFVDGYANDGKRIYDQVKGKTCHQCRQKTLGRHTHCNTCNLVQGQFCGDCLYMRYGENILEVENNPNWICPVCRGICNCSLCRTKKGWAPTGALYKTAVNLGYKSVAHYLIETRQCQTNSGEQTSAQPASSKKLLFSTDGDSDHATNLLRLESGFTVEYSEKNSNAHNRKNSSHHAAEHIVSNVTEESTPKPTNKSKKTKEAAPVEKPSADSIASRLRKRANK